MQEATPQRDRDANGLVGVQPLQQQRLNATVEEREFCKRKRCKSIHNVVEGVSASQTSLQRRWRRRRRLHRRRCQLPLNATVTIDGNRQSVDHGFERVCAANVWTRIQQALKISNRKPGPICKMFRSNQEQICIQFVCLNLLFTFGLTYAYAVMFDGVPNLHVWLTVSSLASKDPTNAKALIFRQIELNWINAPLDDNNDYIGLYLDVTPDERHAMPVSVHKLNGQASGQIITDYYLPQIDFYAPFRSNQRRSDEDRENLPIRMPNSTFSSEFAAIRSSIQPNIRHLSDTNAEWMWSSWSPTMPAAMHPIELDRRDHASGTFADNARNSLSSIDQCIGYCLAYHNRNKVIASNCLKTQPVWMGDSFRWIGGRSMTTLMLPGTHNSGTYARNLDKSVLQMINKYQINQDESIFNQLVYGIRHLDLRVGYTKVKGRSEKFWIYHDIFRTDVALDDVLEQVRRFLELTTHEMIVMDFHRFTVGFQNENVAVQRERHAKMIDMLFAQLGNWIVPSYLGQHAPLQEYIDQGKRLIIGYANRANLISTSGSLLNQPLKQQSANLVALNSTRKSHWTHNATAKSTPMPRRLHHSGSYPSSQTNTIPNDPRNKHHDNPDTSAFDPQADTRVGTRLFNKLKTIKLISKSFSKRSVEQHSIKTHQKSNISTSTRLPIRKESATTNQKLLAEPPEMHEQSKSLSRVALFFSPVRHLWPNQDTLDGLSQYMNETTCRRYFGELRSMMAELTPTVFGAISDKYDGNRKLAQLVNRPITDWIRDKWLHCINIVATDFFLGNDIVRLSIYANNLRAASSSRGASRARDLTLNGATCKSFRKIEHLLDKSKIPKQYALDSKALSSPDDELISRWMWRPHSSHRPNNVDPVQRAMQQPQQASRPDNLIVHTNSDGNQMVLRPLAESVHSHSIVSKDRRDSFVDNVSDGFSSLMYSFKKILNL